MNTKKERRLVELVTDFAAAKWAADVDPQTPVHDLSAAIDELIALRKAPFNPRSPVSPFGPGTPCKPCGPGSPPTISTSWSVHR